jgi:hypothetical protein
MCDSPKKCFPADKCIYHFSRRRGIHYCNSARDSPAPLTFSLWQGLVLASMLRSAVARDGNGES